MMKFIIFINYCKIFIKNKI